MGTYGFMGLAFHCECEAKETSEQTERAALLQSERNERSEAMSSGAGSM
jgi:hypothetical protein